MENYNVKQNTKGFTLIEILVVVAIVAILAAIAFPSYQEQVVKTRRADAEGALMSLSNAMERYYVQNNSYVGAAVGAGGIFPNEAPLDGGTKYYDLSIPAASLTATSYTVRAVPKNAQAGDGCLELLSVGTRTKYSTDNCSGATSTW